MEVQNQKLRQLYTESFDDCNNKWVQLFENMNSDFIEELQRKQKQINILHEQIADLMLDGNFTVRSKRDYSQFANDVSRISSGRSSPDIARIKNMSFLHLNRRKEENAESEESYTESVYQLQEYREQNTFFSKLSEMEGDSGRVDSEFSLT